MYQPSSFTDKINTLLSKHLNNAELILVLVFLAALLIRMTTELNSGSIMIISLSTLSLLYFFRSFTYANYAGIGKMDQFLDKFAHIGLSVAVLGILFRLMRWMGFENFLLMGAITTTAAFLLSFVVKSLAPEEDSLLSRYRLRLLIATLVAIALYQVPESSLVEWGVLETPEFRD